MALCIPAPTVHNNHEGSFTIAIFPSIFVILFQLSIWKWSDPITLPRQQIYCTCKHSYTYHVILKKYNYSYCI